MRKPIQLFSIITVLLALLPMSGICDNGDQNLPVTIEGESEFCEGTSTTLSATPGYVTYSWNTGDFSDTTVVTQAGVYSVVVTDATGCTGIDYFPVEVLEDTSFFIDGPDEICAGLEEHLLTLSEPFLDYVWSDGSTNSTLTISDCDTYSVTVTNMNGCTQSQSIMVDCPASIDIILIENSMVSCIGECDGILEAGLSDNNSNSSLLWSTGSSSPKIDNLCPGEYSVTVTDPTGCYASESYVITEPEVLELVIDSLRLPTCYDDTDGFVIVEALGGTSPYLYFWPEGATGDTISSIGSGIYAVTIVDGNNCDTIIDVIVPNIVPLLINTDSVVDIACFGENTGQLEVSGSGGHGEYIYQWSTGDQTPLITDIPADTYAVTVIDDLGCMTTKLIPVVENPQLSATSQVTHISQQGANDGTATISPSGGSGNYQFLWDNGETTPTILNLSPGEYNCTVNDSEGCQTTITALISEGDCMLSLFTNSTNVDCYGDTDGKVEISTQFGILPIEIIISDLDGNTQDANNLPAGSYVVIVQDAAGCIDQNQVIISQPSELSADIELVTAPTCEDKADGSVMINVEGGSPPYEYLWSNGKTTAIATEFGIGMQSVQVTDANGCNLAASVMVAAEDDIAPELVLKSVELDMPMEGMSELPDPSLFIEAISDNCSETSFTYADDMDITIGCENADYDITIIATDSNGNSVEETTTLTVRDVIAPVITCPSAMVLGECEILNYEVSATDNCESSVEINIVEGSVSGEDIPVGTMDIIVEAIDINGNTALCSFQVSKFATPSIQADKVDLKCFGDTTGAIDILNAEDYETIMIDGEDNGMDNLNAGTYTILATTSYGCETETSVSILSPNLLETTTLAITNESILGFEDGMISIDITGGVEPYLLTWSKDGETITLTSESITELSAGEYQCEIIDANGCITQSDIITIEMGIVSSTDDIELDGDILTIYPNPATDMISIEMSDTDLEVKQVNILDFSGKLQYENYEINKPISVANWSEGIYLIQVITDKGKVVKRLVKL